MVAVSAEAGVSVPRTHDLSRLIGLVSNCIDEEEVSKGLIRRALASRLRDVTASDDYIDAALDQLFEAKEADASKFPSEIRYGHTLEHSPVSIMKQASLQLSSRVKRYASSIQA